MHRLQDPYTIVLKVTDSDVNEIVSMGLWLKPKKQGDRRQPAYEEGRVSPFPIHIFRFIVHTIILKFVILVTVFMLFRLTRLVARSRLSSEPQVLI